MSASSPADQPDSADPPHGTLEQPPTPELQLVGSPVPANRRRQLSTALLVLGVILLIVAIALAL